MVVGDMDGRRTSIEIYIFAIKSIGINELLKKTLFLANFKQTY